MLHKRMSELDTGAPPSAPPLGLSERKKLLAGASASQVVFLMLTCVFVKSNEPQMHLNMQGSAEAHASSEESAAAFVASRPELVETIAAHLDGEDLLRLMAACRSWRAIITDSPTWQHHLDPRLGPLHTKRGSAHSLVPTPAAPFVQKPRLWGAVYAHNFLRNPTFSQTLNWMSGVLHKNRRPWQDVADLNASSSNGPFAFQRPPQGVSHLEANNVHYPQPQLHNTSSSSTSSSSSPPPPFQTSSTPPSATTGDCSLATATQAAGNPPSGPAHHLLPAPYPIPYPAHLPAPRPYPPQISKQHGLVGQVCKLLGAAQEDGLGCVATGQEWAEVIQVVDMQAELVARGLSRQQAAAVLDAGLPLGLRVRVASHDAQAGLFGVGLLLNDGAGDPSQSASHMQKHIPRPSSHHFYSGCLRVNPGNGWKSFSYVVPACPVGFRRAVVLLRGREVRGPPREGVHTLFQGPKFASAELVFLKKTTNNSRPGSRDEGRHAGAFPGFESDWQPIHAHDSDE